MQVEALKIHDNPTPEELRALTEQMPQCRVTEYGNVNVQTKVVSRSSGSTFVVAQASSGKTMTREEFDRIAQMQDDYLREREVIVVDGYIGNDPSFRTRARLSIEAANANIAGMQQKLYFAREDRDDPEVHVIYTPNLPAPGYPDDRVIAVDLERGVTRVLNSDYFGESKKGGLRMWNDIVYGRGGLALHAGLKVIPTPGGEKVFMIIGLSGTGKTTTTFTTQNDSLPVQDDFVALMPGGKAYGTENGCFAKTFSLDPDFEPNIYDAVVKPTTYLENVYQDEAGTVNFFEESYTQNGRAVFEMSDLARSRDATQVGTVDYLLILNRNENIIPAVARLNQEQAAAYFMLGETTGTSAGGPAEAGRFLRVPGTNPFFPLPHGLQGNRILELLGTRGRLGRRRTLEEGEDPPHVGLREGHRRADHPLGRGRGLRLRGRLGGARLRRHGAAPAPAPVRARGTIERVRGDRRAAEVGARRPARGVPRAHARDREGGELTRFRP